MKSSRDMDRAVEEKLEVGARNPMESHICRWRIELTFQKLSYDDMLILCVVNAHVCMCVCICVSDRDTKINQ
jgi:hypothetical protein